MKHNKRDKKLGQRECQASDLFLTAEGLECSNCGARNKSKIGGG